MRKSKFLPVAAAALAIGATSGLAYAKKSDPSGMLAQTKMTLAQAVEKAKARVPGKALEAELKAKRGTVFYEIEIVKDGKIKKIQLDAASGEMLGLKTKSLSPKKISDDEAREVAALKTAQVTLPQAIANAKQKYGGRAIEAELEAEKGKIFYEIKLVKDNRVHEVKVATDDGRILSSKAKR